MGEAVDKLGALLHNGQVCGKICIKHIVKADLLQGRNHALGRGKFRVQVIILRPGSPNRRGNLHHGDLLGIGQGVENPAGVVPLLQGAHRAVDDALSAEGAIGIPQAAGLAHADGGAGAGAHQIPDVHALDLVAHLHAAHTAHAAILNAHHGVGEIVLRLFQVVGVVVTQEVIVVGKLLQLAIAAAGTLGAVGVVLAEQQTHIHPPGLPGPGRIGMHHHALGHHVIAGGDQARIPLDLHHAQPASSNFVDALEIAEGGDFDVHRAGRLQNGGTLRHGDRLSVNDKIYHLSTRPPLKIP